MTVIPIVALLQGVAIQFALQKIEFYHATGITSITLTPEQETSFAIPLKKALAIQAKTYDFPLTPEMSTLILVADESKAEEKKKAEGSPVAGPPPPPPAPPLSLPPPITVTAETGSLVARAFEKMFNREIRFFSSGPRRNATDLVAGTKISTPVIR